MNTKFNTEIFILYREFFKGAKIVGNALVQTLHIYNDCQLAIWPEINLEIIKRFKN